MGLCKNHDALYFDKLIRTNKAEAVLSLILSTYYAEGNSDDEIKKDIATRLQNAYITFKGSAGSYSGGVGQFSSQYTIGHEMGIWKNSRLELTEMAIAVAENRITIRDYFDRAFLNYIQPVNGKIVHLLYHILAYMNKYGIDEISKEEMGKVYMQASGSSKEGEVNGAYNMLLGTNYFLPSNKGKSLSYCGRKSISFLLSCCNTQYIKEGYNKAQIDLNTQERYANYLLKASKQTEYNMNSVTINISVESKFRPYITAIKSKPFLLLAGISGTGKSRIVRELARACWEEDSEEYKAHKPKNFEMVQVKPNWHDSSELIGYMSRIDGEKFVVGDFLKFVVKAWEDPNTPHLLCLDEMNLAPVEQYFAEYLSVVESRKNKDGKVVTDPILKPEYEKDRDPNTGSLVPKAWYANLISSLLATCPPEKAFELNVQFLENGICIPQNLIVVGTVNMDETTFSFSRKVLDRAMTIEMNKVNLKGGLTERYEQIGKLGTAELVGSAVEGVDVYSAHKEVCDKVITYLEVINDKLEGTPFKIAYRTRNEFLLYVVNNLPYNKDEEGKDIEQNFVIARALDEITNMKILSRIEGDETKVSEKFLKGLSDTIKEQLEVVFDGPFGIEETDDTYKSLSLAKLDEMIKKLSSGYTSFWS